MGGSNYWNSTSSVYPLPEDQRKRAAEQGLLGMAAAIFNANRLRTTPGPTLGEALATGAFNAYNIQNKAEKNYVDQLQTRASIDESTARRQKREYDLAKAKRDAKAIAALTSANYGDKMAPPSLSSGDVATANPNASTSSVPQVTPPVSPAATPEINAPQDPLFNSVDALTKRIFKDESNNGQFMTNPDVPDVQGWGHTGSAIRKQYGINQPNDYYNSYQGVSRYLTDLAKKYQDDPEGAKHMLMEYYAGGTNMTDYLAGKPSGVGPKTMDYVKDPAKVRLAQNVIDSVKAETAPPQVTAPRALTPRPRQQPQQPYTENRGWGQLSLRERANLMFKNGLLDPKEYIAAMKTAATVESQNMQWVFDNQTNNARYVTGRQAQMLTASPRWSKYEAPQYKELSPGNWYTVYPNKAQLIQTMSKGNPEVLASKTVRLNRRIVLPNGAGALPKGYTGEVFQIKGQPGFILTAPAGRDSSKVIPIHLAGADVQAVNQTGQPEFYTKGDVSQMMRSVDVTQQGIQTVNYLIDMIGKGGTPTGATGEAIGAADTFMDQARTALHEASLHGADAKVVQEMGAVLNTAERARATAIGHLDSYMTRMKDLLSPAEFAELQGARKDLMEPDLKVIPAMTESLAIIQAGNWFDSNQRIPLEAVRNARKAVNVEGILGPGRSGSIVKLNEVKRQLKEALIRKQAAIDSINAPNIEWFDGKSPGVLQPNKPGRTLRDQQRNEFLGTQ